jgi:hypothetical protein
MVAMICPDKQGDKLSRLFHNQYMSSEGKWTTDFDHKATCRQDKVEILEYCKKVRNNNWPANMTITFIVVYIDVSGQRHQQHCRVQPLHEDWQLVQARSHQVQGPSSLDQALPLLR